MDQKVINAWKNISDQLEQGWPFKRIVASADLIQRYNDTVGKQTGHTLTDFAITVDKDAVVDGQMIWAAMVMKNESKPFRFGDSKRPDQPPQTGRQKNVLV